jgi:hypothetical protein
MKTFTAASLLRGQGRRDVHPATRRRVGRQAGSIMPQPNSHSMALIKKHRARPATRIAAKLAGVRLLFIRAPEGSVSHAIEVLADIPDDEHAAGGDICFGWPAVRSSTNEEPTWSAGNSVSKLPCIDHVETDS